jgi:hypothetical protein
MAMPANASGEPNHDFEPFGDPSPLGDNFVGELLAKKHLDERYDPKLAYAFAVISAWSYATRKTFESKLRRNGFPHCTVSEAAVTNDALFIVATAYVVRSGGLAIIVFRGTEPVNLVSWLTDADVITRDVPRNWEAAGKVHRGFLANLEAVWDGLQAGLADAPPLEAVYVTGHSLGGAMAILTAARLLRTHYEQKLKGIYTYGQPAVGDHAFANWGAKHIGDRLFRHIYNHDLVPHLPPTSSGTFVHFGAEYHSTGRATQETWMAARKPIRPVQFVLFAALGAVLEYAARRTTAFRRLPFQHSIEDHSPAFYISTSRNTLLRSPSAPTAP